MTIWEDGMDGAAAEVDGAWTNFAQELGSYLSSMDGDYDSLRLEMWPTAADEGEGCAPFVEFWFVGGVMLRADMSGDAHLLPQYQLSPDAAELMRRMGWCDHDDEDPGWWCSEPVAQGPVVAGRVVQALRRCFGVSHPQMLTYAASGPASGDVDRLGLCATADVPADDPQPPSGEYELLVTLPSSRDELVAAVVSVLRDWLEGEPKIDDDGDFVFSYRGQPVWVRVQHDGPVIDVFTCQVRRVASSRAAAIEVSLLNRDHRWIKWSVRGRCVWQSVALFGAPFVPGHLRKMLDHFCQVMDETRDDLVLRLLSGSARGR